MNILNWKTILLIFGGFVVITFAFTMLAFMSVGEGELSGDLAYMRTVALESPAYVLGQMTGYGVMFIIIPFSIAKAIKKLKARKSRELESLK